MLNGQLKNKTLNKIKHKKNGTFSVSERVKNLRNKLIFEMALKTALQEGKEYSYRNYHQNS